MIRALAIASMMCLAQPAALWAADTQMASSTTGSQNQDAALREAAEKACNYALDHDRFNYGTMEDCVSDTMTKLAHAHGK